jgi:hypothetical protein
MLIPRKKLGEGANRAHGFNHLANSPHHPSIMILRDFQFRKKQHTKLRHDTLLPLCRLLSCLLRLRRRRTAGLLPLTHLLPPMFQASLLLHLLLHALDFERDLVLGHSPSRRRQRFRLALNLFQSLSFGDLFVGRFWRDVLRFPRLGFGLFPVKGGGSTSGVPFAQRNERTRPPPRSSPSSP